MLRPSGGLGARSAPAFAFACAAASFALCWASPRVARADIVADADRVAEQWKSEGQTVIRAPSVFLESGRPRLLPLGTLQMDGSGCVTAFALGVRTADLSVRAGVGEGTRADTGLRVGGIATMTRCGSDQGEIASAIVELRSLRGAVEVILAKGDEPPSPATKVLIERAAGPLSLTRDPGRPRVSEPFPERVARAVTRSTADGAEAVKREEVEGSPQGSGRVIVTFLEGCHRLELLASTGTAASERSAPHGPFDVDAELREATTDRILARDRSDTADARLEFCVAAPTTAVLLFGGAAPGGRIAVVDGTWSLPADLPTRWGTKARATMARALHYRRVRGPLGTPAAEMLGVSGSTTTSLELVPSTCYVAVVAAARGEARPLQLSIRTAGVTSHDTSGVAGEGTAVAFCTGAASRATAQVDARGSALAWVLSVWKTGPAPLEEGTL
jgi:hypothetical protein